MEKDLYKIWKYQEILKFKFPDPEKVMEIYIYIKNTIQYKQKSYPFTMNDWKGHGNVMNI